VNIVLLGPAYPYRGGLASFNERLARELQQRGHRVHIITFTKQYPDFLFPGKTQFSNSPPPTGLQISRMVHAYQPLNWYRVGRRLQAMDFDLLVTRFWLPFMGPALGTILKQAKKNRRIKTVAIIDNIIPHEKRPGDKVLTKYFVKQVDRFIVLSKFVGHQLRAFTKTKPIAYSPHPLFDNYGAPTPRDEALQYLGLDSHRRYLLFFGFIRAYKGLDILLQAMASERLRNLPVHLIVGGEFYDREEKYLSLIKQHGLSDRVHLFTRFIPDNEVKYFFSAADLVVQPYRSATQSGISQIAMHFGVPMVVTDVGGLREIVKDGTTGLLADPDPASVAGAIARFFSGINQEAMRTEIQKERVLFEWDHFVQTLLDDEGDTIHY